MAAIFYFKNIGLLYEPHELRQASYKMKVGIAMDGAQVEFFRSLEEPGISDWLWTKPEGPGEEGIEKSSLKFTGVSDPDICRKEA